MNQQTTAATPSLRTIERAARASAPIDDAALREADQAEVKDKYDVSTIACTD